jgi:hypothetical protein
LLAPCAFDSSRFGDENGISTLTFHASVAYIELKDPKTFIIEMTWSATIRRQFLEVLRKICPHYALWSGIMDSVKVVNAFRKRFYIIGINVTKVCKLPQDQTG